MFFGEIVLLFSIMDGKKDFWKGKKGRILEGKKRKKNTNKMVTINP